MLYVEKCDNININVDSLEYYLKKMLYVEKCDNININVISFFALLVNIDNIMWLLETQHKDFDDQLMFKFFALFGNLDNMKSEITKKFNYYDEAYVNDTIQYVALFGNLDNMK